MSKRITLKRPGAVQKSFVIVQPPYPDPGETVNLPDGTSWTVAKVKDVGDPLYIDIPGPGRRKVSV